MSGSSRLLDEASEQKMASGDNSQQDFVPILNNDLLNNSGLSSPSKKRISKFATPQKPSKSSVNVSLDINELSVIHNSTVQDTSMNVTNLEIIKKLHANQSNQLTNGNNMILDNFDAQSNATSFFFNEEEMQNYEEHIQQRINDVWS